MKILLRTLALSLVVGLAAPILGPVHPGSAAGAAPSPWPLVIHSASIRQDGLVLRLDLTAVRPFSPKELARHDNALCVVIGRPVTRGLCLEAASGSRRQARLALFTVGGTARFVRATVTQPRPDFLSVSFRPRSIGLSYRSFRWQLRSSLVGNACRAAHGACGPRVFPEHFALARLHVPKPAGCVPRKRSLVFSGSSRRREVALSFDDGPWPDPPSIDFVRLLARYHVPATFFEIGDQIPEYDRTGHVERLMLRDGDMIGDHTWTHPYMTRLSAAKQTTELERTVHAIRHATGFTPCLWRPPYGAQNSSLDRLARRLGMLTVMWSVDTRDWSLPGTASIEKTAIDDARNGSIILMHFGGGPRNETLAALPTIIRGLRRRGFRLVNVATLLGLKLTYR